MAETLRDTISRDGGEIYIGQAQFRQDRIARIKPLAVAREREWQRVHPSDFPEAGLVFSVDPAVVGREKGYVALFTVEPNQTHKGEDRYLTSRVCEPYEVVDEFERLSSDQRQVTATRWGIARGLQRLDRVVLPLGGGRCAFPLMQFDPVVGRWVISHNDDLSAIEVFETDLDGGRALFAIDGRNFVLPGRQPSDVVGAVNWENDADCFERIIKFLKRTEELRSGSDLAQVSKRAIGRLHSAYVQGGLLDSDRQDILALRDRLKTLLPKLENATGYVEEIANELAAAPAVKRRVDELVNEAKEARLQALEAGLRAEITSRVEADITDALAQKETVEQSIRDLRSEEHRLSVELERLSGIRGERLEETRIWLGALIEQVVKGGQGLSDLLNAAREVGVQIPQSAPEDKKAANGAAPWSAPRAVDAVDVSLDELPPVLMDAAKKRGIPLHAIAALDCSLRAGALTALSGPDADYLLDVYAACVTGGELYRMTIDPTVLGPDDVWRHPTTGRKTSFAIAWQAALDNQEDAVLACLDNIDSASLAEWMPTFEGVLSRSRPRNLFVAAIVRRPREKPPGELPAPRSGTVVQAGPYPDAARSVVHSGGAAIVRKRTLKAPFLSEIIDDDRIELTAISEEIDNLGSEDALRFVSLAAAAKPWMSVDAKLRDLPRELIGVGVRRPIAKGADDA